nr:DUF4231 domain-containing protein [Tumebacillus amylolyticus]
MQGSAKWIDSDNPSLYKKYDSRADKAQSTHLKLVKWNLRVTILSAVLLVYAFPTAYTRWVAVGSSFLLMISIFLFFVIRVKKFDRTWYEARAASETVKSLAWKYALGAKPYPFTLPAAEAGLKMIEDFNTLLTSKSSALLRGGAKSAGQEQITKTMQDMRQLSWRERMEVYIHGRLLEQQEWHANKSEFHEIQEDKWFLIVVFCYFLALCASISLAILPELPVKLTGIFTTTAGAVLSWGQLKRHQELAQSYALVSEQLGLVYTKRHAVETEEELSAWVETAEEVLANQNLKWVQSRLN